MKTSPEFLSFLLYPRKFQTKQGFNSINSTKFRNFKTWNQEHCKFHIIFSWYDWWPWKFYLLATSSIHSFLYIRTSKFCLRRAVLIFFSFLRLKCSNLFLFAQLNLAMPQRRMSDWVGMIKIQFHFFLSGSARHDIYVIS